MDIKQPKKLANVGKNISSPTIAASKATFKTKSSCRKICIFWYVIIENCNDYNAL